MTENWETVRLVISVLTGIMGAVYFMPKNATEEQQKAAAGVALMIGIAIYVFIKVLLILAGIVTFAAIVIYFGPALSGMARKGMQDFDRERDAWKKKPSGMQQIKQALESGMEPDKVLKLIECLEHKDDNDKSLPWNGN